MTDFARADDVWLSDAESQGVLDRLKQECAETGCNGEFEFDFTFFNCWGEAGTGTCTLELDLIKRGAWDSAERDLTFSESCKLNGFKNRDQVMAYDGVFQKVDECIQSKIPFVQFRVKIGHTRDLIEVSTHLCNYDSDREGAFVRVQGDAVLARPWNFERVATELEVAAGRIRPEGALDISYSQGRMDCPSFFEGIIPGIKSAHVAEITVRNSSGQYARVMVIRPTEESTIFSRGALRFGQEFIISQRNFSPF